MWSVLDENNTHILVSLADPVWHHANKFDDTLYENGLRYQKDLNTFLPAWPDDDLCKIWRRSDKRSGTSKKIKHVYLNQNG